MNKQSYHSWVTSHPASFNSSSAIFHSSFSALAMLRKVALFVPEIITSCSELWIRLFANKGRNSTHTHTIKVKKMKKNHTQLHIQLKRLKNRFIYCWNRTVQLQIQLMKKLQKSIAKHSVTVKKLDEVQHYLSYLNVRKI